MRAWPIYVTYFFLTSAIGVVFVFLEDVQTRNGLADWEIGVVAGTGFAAALVAGLTLSPLADRGRTRGLAVLALITGVIGPIGFAFGTTVEVLAFSRGLTGIGLGLFGLVARKALLGLDAEGGGAKLGVLLSTAVAGFIIGPILGAVSEPLGFAAPFLGVAAAIAVCGIPATTEILRAEIAVSPADYSDLGRLLRRPKVQAAVLVQVIVLGFIGIFDSVIDRFLTDLGASTTEVAITVMFVGAPLLILPRIAGNLAESRGATSVMLPALTFLLPAMLGYGLVGSVVLVTLCGLLHGSAESFATISAQVLVLEVTGAKRAAVGSAVLDAAGLTSATITAVLGPILYGQLDQRVFLATAAVGLVLAALAVLRARQGSDAELEPTPAAS